MKLISDLLDLEIPNSVRLSPNSQQVLYSTTLLYGHKKADHAVSTIWVAETGKTKSSRQLTSGLFNDCSPKWCSDGKSIAFVSDRAKQGVSSAIYMLPIQSGGEAYPLTPAENERSIDEFEFSPDGNFIAYTSADEKTADKKAREKDKDDANVWGEDWAYNRLRLVHVATKTTTTLVSRDAHIELFAWNDDGTKLAFAESETPDIEFKYARGMKISIVDVASRDVKELCAIPEAIGHLTWVGDVLYYISTAAEGALLMSSHMVYSIDLRAKTVECSKCAHGSTDCARGLTKAGQDVVVQVQSGMEDQIHILNGRVLYGKKTQLQAWDAAFTTDSDEMILAIAQEDSNCPAEVYTLTASGGAMVQLSNHASGFADRKFGSATFLSCPSADKEVYLDALHVAPFTAASANGKPEKPLPTVVLIHGGPYARVTEGFDTFLFMWGPVLLDAGYAVLFPNYRGGSGKGEKFAAYARGGCGIYDYADVISLTQHAIEEGYADKERLVVGGWSQGGFLSFIAAVRNGLHGHGWRFKAAIPGAGVADGDTMCMTSDVGALQAEMAGKAPWECDKDDTSGRSGGAIWEFKAAVDKGGVIPPMLILHGEKDDRVPLEQSTAFRRALTKAKLPFEFVTYPREEHVIKERKHLVDMAERVLRFVDTHIGGAAWR